MKLSPLQWLLLTAACVITVIFRVQGIPFDSVIALSLMCGALVRRPLLLLLPLLVRLITDVVIEARTGYGFYPSMVFDYSAYLMITLLARQLTIHPVTTMLIGGLAGPLLFFAISNLGVWYLWPDTYASTLAGLWDCYVKGLPFLRPSVLGNLGMSALLTAAWHAAAVHATETVRDATQVD